MITSDYYGITLSVPGIGETTCGEIDSAAYKNSSLNSDTCPVVGEYAREVCCFEFSSCEVCGPNGVIPHSNDDVTTMIPGIGEVTCYDISLAAYSSSEPSWNETSCSILSEVAMEPCCSELSNVTCYLCGASGFIPRSNDDFVVSVPGIGNTTCYDIYYGAYVNGDIDSDSCPDVSAAAKESCCFYDSNIYYEPCYICGPGQNVSNSGGILTTPEGDAVSCELIEIYALKGYLNETECSYVSGLSVRSCCGAASGSSVPSPPSESKATDSPSETNVAKPSPGSPSTLSGVSGRPSTKMATLMVCIASTLAWLVK